MGGHQLVSMDMSLKIMGISGKMIIIYYNSISSWDSTWIHLLTMIPTFAGTRSPGGRGQGGLRHQLHGGSVAGAGDATRQGQWRSDVGGHRLGLGILWKSYGKHWKIGVLGGCLWNFEWNCWILMWSKEVGMMNNDQTRVISHINVGVLINLNIHKMASANNIGGQWYYIYSMFGKDVWS